ncbi:mitochondrial fission ELM1 family protein [Marinobacter salinisoli]|uniref:Mitochondrial fission ELM1 family protein n=1 Tax=Marinobacter salinisoli TaxID=2769486 RepID=A0ABX7MV63_9GAMM|nr:ELM1/GtrOC1 family putative glycosyltransferase [Marinobacter salinisoli]QSP96064.1 mitochondrial fission ELM1 family protein [Marinobacter salinisoli]
MANLDTEFSEAPVVWLLTDNKPGHRNQLKGLGNRLRVLAGASLHWIDTRSVNVPLWRALLAIPPSADFPAAEPDLIVAAGSGTHRLLLALRRKKKASTLVLMKPGFPFSWVSAVITPDHDQVADGPNVLLTEGVINTITPMARITDKPEALILVGGPCPHFDWDDDVLLGQIHHLINHYPGWRWTISGSRRTPEPLLHKLQELAGLKITVVGPDRTHQDWLNHQVSASRAIWVSPDSMSMVCEAATSGVPTGIFQLTPVPGSRVAAGIDQLVQNGRVARWSDHASVMTEKPLRGQVLWEADRAARWVVTRGLLPLPTEPRQDRKRGED